MKRIFYHGTSADNLKSILKHGITGSEPKLWNCSAEEVYLWDAEAVGKEFDCDSEEDSMNRTFQMASESAQIACIASKDCRLVVIKVLIDDSEIMADNSCENMEGKGAVCIGRTIKPSEIVEIQISNDLSMLKGYFIALMSDNEYFSVELTPLEKKIGQAFKTAELYPEDIDDLIEWEIVKTKKAIPA